MSNTPVSIRPFIGSGDFNLSRRFYQSLGWEEIPLEPRLSLFKTGNIAFYLQDYNVQDWIDNTVVFVEVPDLEAFYQSLIDLRLGEKFPGVKVQPIRHNSWGDECFLIDPSGILWHFGSFKEVATR
ncbi:MAG TPA: glyoxalase [Flavihumibacter sp.]|jgi:hypothetical protein